jgi:MHS family proline/betaine transporter-like MFS transporter
VIDAAVSPGEKRRVFWAATIGATVEWFDYAIYGALAPVIATNFFPGADRTASLLATFGVFALSFLIRPLGSCYFGSRGDREGRPRITALVVLVMSAATAAIGLLPTHRTAGVLAPVLLLALRLVQGFSAGGELGAAAVLYEYIGPGRRGLLFGTFNVSSYASSLGALGLAALATQLLGPAGMTAWGWRALFLVALPLGLSGLYLRLRVLESPVFDQLRRSHQIDPSPLRTLFRAHRRPLFAFFGLIMLNSVAFYVLNAYLPTYLSETAGVPRTTALWASTAISLRSDRPQPTEPPFAYGRCGRTSISMVATASTHGRVKAAWRCPSLPSAGSGVRCNGGPLRRGRGRRP